MLFQHQVVRDLAWCCSSAPLLRALPNQHVDLWPKTRTVDVDWLMQLDRHPQILLDEIAQLKSTRLGIYYETLWRFYWQQHPHFQLLAHNLQITEQGKTLGAFDFIVREADAVWHIETAVKFYLGSPTSEDHSSSWHEWIGPNCNDRLDLKLSRLLDHQLPLRLQQASQPALANLATDGDTWRSALCLQGYLFYPAHTAMHAPQYAHAEHQRGSWWYLKDFTTEAATGYWVVLPRHQWLSPAQTDDIHNLLSREMLLDHLQHWVMEMERPQLIAAMEKRGDIWQEKDRGFVVPDHWPWTETPSRKT